jgi:L-2-hydroxyglutarate oxidase
MRFGAIVVGGGIVGLSSAFALSTRHPDLSIVLIEKEPGLAQHQTGHNSGVVHSGIYYRPGSLKATLSIEGSRRTIAFCEEHGIAVARTGKVIVATRYDQLAALDAMFVRGRQHGLEVERLSPAGVREHEPHAAAVGAIFVPETGVCDFAALAARLGELLTARGVTILCGRTVRALGDGFADVDGDRLSADVIVNCAGLGADLLAAGLPAGAAAPLPARIIAFRGEYYDITGPSADLIRHLIYPLPEPGLPFLGVHITRGFDGRCHAGPNAVLALAREGYRWSDVSGRHLAALARYRGSWRLAANHWRTGVAEVARSASRRLFIGSLRRLVPAIDAADVHRGGAGVRAQAVAPDGSLVDDFLFVTGPRAVHVLNAPSPAATAALPIGEYIADRAEPFLLDAR